MNASDPVVGCSTCGALYSPVPGDTGHCAACSSLLLDDPPARAAEPAPRGQAAHPLPGAPNSGRAASVTRLEPRRPRSFRRVLIALVAAGSVALLGAAIASRRHQIEDAWKSAQRHSPREAWTAARQLASNGWSAVRRRLPFLAPEPERSVSSAPAKRVAVRGTKTRKTR